MKGSMRSRCQLRKVANFAFAYLALSSLLLSITQTVNALPILALDLNPDQSGVQSLRTVEVGERFEISLSLIEDSGQLDLEFNAATGGFAYNDSGLVLNHDRPAHAGMLANSPGNLIDAFAPGLAPVVGSILAPAPAASAAAPGAPAAIYAALSRIYGMVNLGSSFLLGPGELIDLFRFEVDALAVGHSNLTPYASPGPAIAQNGLAVDIELQSARVNVIDPTISVAEPAPLGLLLMLALAVPIRRIRVLSREAKSAREFCRRPI